MPGGRGGDDRIRVIGTTVDLDNFEERRNAYRSRQYF